MASSAARRRPAGAAVRFHSLRHFAASSMLAGGAPITAVAGHLGDTVETISKVYLHWLRDDRSIPRLVLDRLLADDAAEAVGAVTATRRVTVVSRRQRTGAESRR